MAVATEVFTNNAQTTVSSGGTGAPASGTTETWTVASSSSFPAIGTGQTQQFHVADPASASEKILVKQVSGTTWTVVRGDEGTTPVTHAPLFTINQVATAAWLGSALTGLQSTGDTTGVKDAANMNGIANLGANLILGPGTFWVNTPVILASGGALYGPRAFAPMGSVRDAGNVAPATIKVPAATTMTAVVTDAAYTAAVGVTNPVPSSDIQIAGIDIDCSGITGGGGHGIALLTQASAIVNCRIRNSPGHSILLTDTSATGNTTTGGVPGSLNECAVIGNRVYQPGLNGIFVQSAGALGTDGYCYDNVVDHNFTGTGTSIAIDQCSGWRVAHNHVYAVPADAYHLFRASNCWIHDNYADNFGQNSTTGITYFGFKIQPSPFGTCRITNNHASTKEAAGGAAGNFTYFSVVAQAANQNNEVYFAGNGVRRITNSSGTFVPYSFDAGAGGSMTVRGVTSALTYMTGSPATVNTGYPTLANGPVFPDFHSGVTTYTTANPAGTVSATLVMMGLALAYTPAVTGKLKITLECGLKNSVASTGATAGLRTGTGTAPVNGAAVTGTLAGKDQFGTGGPSTGFPAIIMLTGTVTGLTPGTAAWADAALSSNVGTTTLSLVNVYAEIQEVA